MITSEFAHVSPTSICEAMQYVESGGMAYCGGTEIVAALSMGLVDPELMVSLRRVRELKNILVASHELAIGATVTHTELTKDRLIRERFPIVSEVCGSVGNSRVRDTGTIGGNLAFADPRSDLTTLLVAMEASVRLLGPSGERSLSVSDFLVDAYETCINRDELIVGIAVPHQIGRKAAFRKVAITERPVVNVVIAETAGGWRVALGAATPVPLVIEEDTITDFDVAGFVDSAEFLEDSQVHSGYVRFAAIELIERCIYEIAG